MVSSLFVLMSLGALERQLSQIITPARSFSRFRNCENMIEKLRGENSCRQSRRCRLLGNPVAFALVELLAENKELNPSEMPAPSAEAYRA